MYWPSRIANNHGTTHNSRQQKLKNYSQISQIVKVKSINSTLYQINKTLTVTLQHANTQQ